MGDFDEVAEEGSLSGVDGRERLRRRYRPAVVRLLFIGESPPASGRFFYRRDSGLYRALRDAFHAVDPSIGEERFLEYFREAGCYLIDACSEPVDQMEAPMRRAACRASEPALARAIARLQPGAIAILLRSIEGNVRRAAELAQWHGRMIELSYPGRWARHRREFVRALGPELEALLGGGFGARGGN